jgi:2',3'-cyclic-nucleotide 2'-phosphodiesterase (5'-nucleotidase family)
MNSLQRNCFLIPFAAFIISCNSGFLPSKAEYDDYKITDSLAKDSIIALMLKPYRDSVYESMKEIVGVTDMTLERKSPESTLGNFVADAIYFSARQKFNTPIDAAFVNYNGIRITTLPKGNITKEKIFELMPFDNLLVIQRLTGSVLQEFLDFTAQLGGWPSAGIKMQIKNKKAVNVFVGGKPLSKDSIYTVVNSDYIANGGDNAIMLTSIPQQNIGYLFRDALFDYIKLLKTQGKNISAKEENRISNVQ